MSDESIPDEGVDRKFATAVQRTLIDFWMQMHQAFLATGNDQDKLTTRCWKKLQAVHKKSYMPLVPESEGVFTGEQFFFRLRSLNMSKPIATPLSGTSRKASISARSWDLHLRIFMTLPRSKKSQGAPGGDSTLVTFHHSD